jgi:glutathione S-transferase
MSATLYVILGSHACRTGMLLMEHKRIPYRTVTLPTGMHPMLVRFAGFAGSSEPFRDIDGKTLAHVGIIDRLGTVPALLMDGERVQTNVSIARFLDEKQPDPPLFPADPDERREVEAAEAWGDDELQMVARRLGLASAQRGENTGDGGRLGPLLTKHAITRRGVMEFTARFFAVDEEAEASLLAELPGMLDRIDTWIGAGTLDGEQLNAADYMIASSLALLSYCPDLRPGIEERPAGRLVERVFA